MDKLQLKKVVFKPTEIILLKKRGNVVVDFNDIEWIYYRKPTLFNWIFSTFFPGVLYVHLNKSTNKLKGFSLRIKYKDFLKLSEIYQKKLDKLLIKRLY